jgi:hypothetical protein
MVDLIGPALIADQFQRRRELQSRGPYRRAAGEAQLRMPGSTATQPDERTWAQRLALSGRTSEFSREGTDGA